MKVFISRKSENATNQGLDSGFVHCTLDFKKVMEKMLIMYFNLLACESKCVLLCE